MARRVHVVALAFTALALLAGALGEPEGCPDEPVVAAKVDAGADVEVVEAVPTTPVRLSLAAQQHGDRRGVGCGLHAHGCVCRGGVCAMCAPAQQVKAARAIMKAPFHT